MTTFPLSFSADGRTLYMLSSRGRDTSALVAFDMETGESWELTADARADALTAIFHPRTARHRRWR